MKRKTYLLFASFLLLAIKESEPCCCTIGLTYNLCGCNLAGCDCACRDLECYCYHEQIFSGGGGCHKSNEKCTALGQGSNRTVINEMKSTKIWNLQAHYCACYAVFNLRYMNIYYSIRSFCLKYLDIFHEILLWLYFL